MEKLKAGQSLDRLTELSNMEGIDPVFTFGLLKANPVNIGDVRLAQGVSFPEHKHADRVEIILCYEGEFTMMIGDKRHTLKPGDVMKIEKGVPHNFTNVKCPSSFITLSLKVKE